MRQYAWCGADAAQDPTYREQCARVILARKNLPDWARVDAPGHVVEFLRSGKPACGVLVRKGRLWLVVDVHGKEDHVPRDRIVDICSTFIGVEHTHNEMALQLREIDQERDRLRSEMDLHELWEVVRGEADREWTLQELAALYFAKDPGPNDTAALFRALLEGRQFRRHGARFVPLGDRKVKQHDREDMRAAEKVDWLDEAAAWIRGIADGVEIRRPSDADHALDMLADRALHGDEAPEAKQAGALAKAAHFRSPRAIVDALVKAGRWSPDENLDLLRHDVPIAFSREAEAEAKSARWDDVARRASALRVKRVYTFADGHAGDRLAFSIGRHAGGGYVVGIHIAVPGLLMADDGAIWRAARERVLELRLPDQTVALLPEALVDRVRFVSNELRPSLTCRVRFDARFQLLGWAFEVRRVRVSHALSVDDSDRSPAGDWGLPRLAALAAHLPNARVEAGAVVLPEPTVDAVAEDGCARLVRTEHDCPARLVEEELTVLANTLAAEFCRLEEIAAIHRAEDPPSRILADARAHDPVECYQQKRLMPRATLQTAREPHHGLGVQAYVPVTEPVSRYTDLLMQRQVLSALAETAADDEECLSRALLETLHGREVAREIELNSRRYWLIRHLEARVGEDVTGVILDQFANGYLIELSETAVRVVAPIRFGTALPVGCRVRVRLTTACAREDEIRVGAPVRVGKEANRA